jgi:putative tryptophan/tyrosine transport system substrate-binding protein
LSSIAVTIFTLAAAHPAWAQDKLRRIGWLSPPPAATGAPELEALRKALSELGHIEGRNIAIEERWADRDAGRLRVKERQG